VDWMIGLPAHTYKANHHLTLLAYRN
jgi:hypothetical protein